MLARVLAWALGRCDGSRLCCGCDGVSCRKNTFVWDGEARSTGHYLRLYFHSDLSVVYSGYSGSIAPLPSIRYYLEDACPGPVTVYTSSYTEIAVTRQDTYVNYMTCSIIVVGSPVARVSLTRFFTESCCDFLTIYDGSSTGSPTLATLSGWYTAPTVYTASGSSMLLQWKSDLSVVYAGFAGAIASSTFFAANGCPGPVFVYPADGTTELSWLSYVNNMNCAVVVQSPTTVTARFTSFATELYVPGVPTVNAACARTCLLPPLRLSHDGQCL